MRVVHLTERESRAVVNLLTAMLATDETDPDRPYWIAVVHKLKGVPVAESFNRKSAQLGCAIRFDMTPPAPEDAHAS